MAMNPRTLGIQVYKKAIKWRFTQKKWLLTIEPCWNCTLLWNCLIYNLPDPPSCFARGKCPRALWEITLLAWEYKFTRGPQRSPHEWKLTEFYSLKAFWASYGMIHVFMGWIVADFHSQEREIASRTWLTRATPLIWFTPANLNFVWHSSEEDALRSLVQWIVVVFDRSFEQKRGIQRRKRTKNSK